MLIDEEDDGFVFSLSDENNSIIRSHNIMKEKEEIKRRRAKEISRLQKMEEDGKILLANFMRVLDDPQQARASMLIWNLWKRRNGKVWDNTSFTSQSVVHQYDIFYQVWIRAQENNNHQRSSSVHQHHHQQVSSWLASMEYVALCSHIKCPQPELPPQLE
ncbi:hypothetical protein JHK86_051972 [Glycine max]|nr:hypothetical protein JHK86_051972 [Glycine max]